METSTMDPKERNEAVKEAMLLKKMDHPNIVRFQEVFMTRKCRLCIVMDYADGGDVHQEIKRREGKLIQESRVLEWFVQTCIALKHVHERKVLHRDLKTQNIFLMATGQIKLGDFGIAKVLEATKDYAKTMVGTPYYLSPEIIEDRPYSFKSDVWSCGVVLYEMATLRHPFDADSLVILAGKILRDQHPPVVGYSEPLNGLVNKMLAKDARLRPTISDVLDTAFLQSSMAAVNTKYALGLDLSMHAAVAAAAAPPREMRVAPEDSDSVLMATMPVHDHPKNDDDYEEEEFEDYEEDEEEEPHLEFGQSVVRTAPSAGLGAGAVGGKAESLRNYLCSQVTSQEFRKAYTLVRTVGQTDGLQQQVSDVIGSDKAPELLTLFQLLIFLEDVAATSGS
uniref:non-specific serine/threonine protein kinase n=1 Tax=Noctiluca scintillans TaxID=2966 RepID=A0A7S0ZLX4_NOCSC